MQNEPVSIAAGIEAVIIALLALCVGLKWIDAEVSGLLLGVATALIGVIAVAVRSKVTPVAKLPGGDAPN